MHKLLTFLNFTIQAYLCG